MSSLADGLLLAPPWRSWLDCSSFFITAFIEPGLVGPSYAQDRSFLPKLLV